MSRYRKQATPRGGARAHPYAEQQGASPQRTAGGPEQHTTVAAPNAQATPHQPRRHARHIVIDAAKQELAAAPIVAPAPVSQLVRDPWN